MMSRIDSRHWNISIGRHFQNGRHNNAQIQHCPILTPFHMLLNFCGIVSAILKMETGRNFSMSGINSGRWNRTMLNLCGIVAAILKLVSRIDSRHWKISTGRHFQNGRHNTAQIQHCPISTPFHMWVDYDVSNWFLTSASLYTHI
jgi:hypothetical protein